MAANPSASVRDHRRDLGAEAQELRELKNQFLASLNHEVRTPLSGILGMTDLLLETKLDGEQREYVDAARSCAEALLALFNSVLEFSELSAGRLTLDEVEFGLLDTVRAAVMGYAPKAEAKGLKLTCRFSPETPGVAVGDAFRLRQSLSCLADNAVKFTESGEVAVEVSAAPIAGGKVSLMAAVRDTGIGIEMDKLPSVFEPFRQLDAGLARNYAGLGLGLAIAQKLARLMGGEIHATSRFGHGSTFCLTVPLRAAETCFAARPSLVGGGRSGSPRILVVEDDPLAQRITRHALTKGRYDVRCAGNGQEAVRAASSGAYDLILMDLQVPGMDGFEITRAIRLLPEYRNVPILALTANTTDEYRRRCFEYGMQELLAKPARSEALLDAVSRHLS